MNSERQIPNGWYKFLEGGYAGIKDFDGKIIISPKMGYTDIGDLYEETSFAEKNGKWGLIDYEGKPLCSFIYDRIFPAGKGFFKGHLFKGKTSELVVEYKDTSHSCEVMNSKGDVLCGREKGYYYISEFHGDEATAAYGGACGIINPKGDVIVPFHYKFIQPMGDELYLVSYENSDNYWAEIINKDEQVVIPASMQYRSIHEFINHRAAAFQNGKWGLIDDKGNHVSEFKYNYVKPCGEGYFMVEVGAKKNVMRPDGSLVLSEWYNDVFKVNHGFFIFGNTIRKSKDNPKTRYLEGVACVNGDIVFPMIFERVTWIGDNSCIYAQIGTKPYLLTLHGGISDPEGSHLPKKVEVDPASFFENLANWVLPGLQFFYRDTNAKIDAARYYHKGDTVRAGFYVDATTMLLKPAHRTRFLIASAHAACFFEEEEFVRQNPNLTKWNLATFHFNSMFKVMDVYETPYCTQVLLLHLPISAAILLDGETQFQFLDTALGEKTSLVDMARKSLDEKLKMGFHDRSFDEELCKRMERPIGLGEDLSPLPIMPIPEPVDRDLAELSNIVHRLAQDSDIDFKIEEKDNFNWNGPLGTVCDGCIYAKSINSKGEGCGRLFQKSFREHVIKGHCDYYKTDLETPSEFEERAVYNQKQKIDTEEKQSDVYAIRLLKEFVSEKLNGDINKLKDFDLSTLNEDGKYGDYDISRANIAKAIMSLAFGGDWPELNVDSINHYDYRLEPICHFVNLLGSNIMDKFFKGLQKFDPSPELHQRAVKCAHLTYNIGNLIILPNKFNDKESLSNYRGNSKFRGYMDSYLKTIYDVMTEQKKQDLHMKGILYKNRKMMVSYQGDEGFSKFIHAMLLEPFVDDMCIPKKIFKGIWSSMKDLDRETYLNAVEEYIEFCNDFIPKRAEKIINRIKPMINN